LRVLAKKLGCKALFARREQELVKEMEKKEFDVEILFLKTSSKLLRRSSFRLIQLQTFLFTFFI